MKKLVLLLILLLAGCMEQFANHYIPQLVYTQTPTVTQTKVATQTQTPIPTNTPVIVTPTLVATPTRPSSYSVKVGDTLIQIAQEFEIPFGYLADQNDIKNPDIIYVGQVLKIPTWPPKYDGRTVYVVLSEQKLYALEDGNVTKEFLVSTGTSEHPTVTGHFEIYVKYEYAGMSGPGYNLANVPSVMYFYKDYGLHGTYWHNNFGHPMSHGCVNLSEKDALWLFDWASVGTPVIVVE